jgi:hypothetical protein
MPVYPGALRIADNPDAIDSAALALGNRTLGVPQGDAARDVLDRAGYKQTERVEVTGELSIAAILRGRRLKRNEEASAAQKLWPAAPDDGELPEGADPEHGVDD